MTQSIITAEGVSRVHAYYCDELRRYAIVVFTQCSLFLMAMSGEEMLTRIPCVIADRDDTLIAGELSRKLRRITDCDGYVYGGVTWLGVGHSQSDSRVLAMVVITAYPGVRKLATAYHYSKTAGVGDVIFNLDSLDLKPRDSMEGPFMDLLG